MLKYLVTSLIVPPGLFVTLSACAGAWLIKGKNRRGGGILLVLAGVIWAFSSTPVSDRLMRTLEAPFARLPEPRGDVIVLLGGGVNGFVPDLTGTGAPSGDMLARLVTAVRLQKRMRVPVIVSGGKVFATSAEEAPIVSRFLVDLGVPADRIIAENNARDTFENAEYTAVICRQYGYDRPLLVTSAYHMRRAVASFARFGVKVTPFPAGFHTREKRRTEWQDLLPNPASLRDSSIALREHLGLIAYRYLR